MGSCWTKKLSICAPRSVGTTGPGQFWVGEAFPHSGPQSAHLNFAQIGFHKGNKTQRARNQADAKRKNGKPAGRHGFAVRGTKKS